MHCITTSTARLAYVESGEGEPLLLLHGAQSDRRQFDVFRPLLGAGIRAIASDQRDSPDSPWTAGGYTAADHADDAAALVDELGLSAVHVMGTSYGGIVAMNLALRHPGKVRSLVLAATAPAFAQFTVPDLVAAREQGPATFERLMLETVISPDALDADPQLVADTRAGIVMRDPASLARRMAAVADHDLRERLGEIGAPTLVLCGDGDPIISIADAEAMAGAIPRARIEILAGSRHGVTLQHRERTADIVRAFVLEHASEGQFS